MKSNNLGVYIMSKSKAEKLRDKIKETKERRDKLTESIRKLQSQLIEEENKEFQMVLNEIDLSFEEAVRFLKNQSIPHHAMNRDTNFSEMNNQLKTTKENTNEII